MGSITTESTFVSDGIHIIYFIKSVVFNEGQCFPPRGHLAMLGEFVGYYAGGGQLLASS